MADVAVTTEPGRRHWRHRWPLKWDDVTGCWRCDKVPIQIKRCTVCGKIKSRRPS